MGLCRRLLRAQWDRVHSVVPAGVRQVCEHAPGTDCNRSAENGQTGRAGMAAEAVAGYAVYSWNLVDSTSRGNVEAASLRLTDEEYQQLTSVSEPAPSFRG
jgi:hypothetical protein